MSRAKVKKSPATAGKAKKIAKTRRPMTAGRAKKIAKNVLVHVILAILVVIWLFPIFWIIMTSLRGEGGAYTNYFFPEQLTFNNYKRLFTETTLLNFPRAFMNTLIISIFSCLISTTFVLSVSYCMSRLRFKMRKPFMNLAMILGLFPAFMSMVAVYFILKAVGLTEGSGLRIALILIILQDLVLDFISQRDSLIRYQSLCQRQRFWMDVISSRYFTRSSFRSASQSLYIRFLPHSLLHGSTSYSFVLSLDQRINTGQYRFFYTICWRKSL